MIAVIKDLEYVTYIVDHGAMLFLFAKLSVLSANFFLYQSLSRSLAIGCSSDQGCIIRSILPSRLGARKVSSEHVENMEMFSCSPTYICYICRFLDARALDPCWRVSESLINVFGISSNLGHIIRVCSE